MAMNTNCGQEADLSYRATLPQSTVPEALWSSGHYGLWGPPAATYPPVKICPGMNPSEFTNFQRDRVAIVAKSYIGLEYRHHHIPGWDSKGTTIDGETLPNSGKGLDCSNYSSWVYNYGLGIKFTSDVVKQSQTVGAIVPKDKPLQVGDLLFFFREDFSSISHVGIYLGDGVMIDSHSRFGGVTQHTLYGWYKTHMAYARRVVS